MYKSTNTATKNMHNLSVIRWNKALPVKVDIHSWRLLLDCIPTCCNLDDHVIEIHSKRCLICDNVLDTTKHLFFNCLVADKL